MTTRRLRHIALCISLFSLISAPAGGRDVTFSWTANPEPVDGYKLYYKVGSEGGLPYDGQGVREGDSPVSTGNVTQYTLHDLADDQTYHFTLTAYRDTEESPFATEIPLPPVATTTETATAIFSWLPNTEPSLAGYKIHYGTTSGIYTSISDIGLPAAENGRIHGQVSGLALDATYYFAVTAYDGMGQESDYSVEVTWPASPPSGSLQPLAEDSTHSTTEDQPLTATVSASSPAGLALLYTVIQQTSLGSLNLDADTGVYLYTPNTNVNGTDSFTFTASDINGTSAPATVQIAIAAVNDPPVATDTALSGQEDSPLNGSLSATDIDSASLSFQLVTPPAHGQLNLAGSGAFTYTPEANYNGTDAFTFQASDGAETSNLAAVSLNITPVNDPPQATDRQLSGQEDTPLSATLQASDIDSSIQGFSIVNPPQHGSVQLSNPQTGTFAYQPEADYYGTDAFSFTASDGQATSAPASVQLRIDAVNDQPAAASFSVTVDEATPYSGQLRAIDPDNDPLTFSLVSGSSQGETVVTPTGGFTYTPAQGASGTDSFQYRVSDGQLQSNAALVSLDIATINEPPLAQAAILTAVYDTPLEARLPAMDPDGDSLTYTIVDDPEQAVVLIDPGTGAFSFTPHQAMGDGYGFIFAVQDPDGATSSARIDLFLSSPLATVQTFGDSPDATAPGTLRDSYTNLNTENYADQTELQTYTWSGSTPHKPANTIILQLDLTALPANAHILGNRLYLYQTGASGDEEVMDRVHAITGVEPIISEVNGYQAATDTPWTAVTAEETYQAIPLGLGDMVEPELNGQLLGQEHGFRSWSLSEAISQAQAAGQETLNLLLVSAATQVESGRSFASSEYPDPALRPRIMVSYVLPPPAPTIESIEELK